MVNFRIIWTLCTGAVENSAYQTRDWTAQLKTVPTGYGKIRAITSVGAVSNRIGAVENSAYQTRDWTAQLEILVTIYADSSASSTSRDRTAPTKHGERKCLHILMIHYN